QLPSSQSASPATDATHHQHRQTRAAPARIRLAFWCEAPRDWEQSVRNTAEEAQAAAGRDDARVPHRSCATRGGSATQLIRVPYYTACLEACVHSSSPAISLAASSSSEALPTFPSGTTCVSPVRRSRSSTPPAASDRAPIVTRSGMPSRSASL